MMNEKQYPTLEDVRQMQVRHGKLIAADIHSSSHGMMAFSGISDTFTLKGTSGEFVLLHSHKSEMDGTDEKLYRADADALKKIEEIAERENLWAWGEMRIDPEKDDRPKMFDYSSSWGIKLYTDDKEDGIFSFNCDTAKFYGGDDVVGQIRDILHSFAGEKNLLSERHLPVTDPRVLEMKKNMFGMPMGTDVKPNGTPPQNSGEWKCPVCNAEGNKGKFCVNCAAPKPAAAAEKEPEQPAQTDFVYTGGEWKCPKCSGEGNTGKFCLTCGSWRPDLDPDKDKKPEPAPESFPVKEFIGSMGVPSGITDMLKASGLIPEDKPDEQFAALLAKPAQHGRLTKFEHHCWSNGMTPNSHHEDTTTAEWTEIGEVTVRWYMQQGTADAMVTDYKAGEKVIAELEKLITESNLTNLGQLKYDRSKDPFSGMTDTSGDSYYTMIFDDSSVGGNKSAYFKLDPAAISQHGGGAIAEKLRDFTQRLCTESEMLSSHLEPPKTPAMSGFMGMGMLMTQQSSAEKWTCTACGNECSGGKFCNKCGNPKE